MQRLTQRCVGRLSCAAHKRTADVVIRPSADRHGPVPLAVRRQSDFMRQGGNYNKNTAAAPLAYKIRYLRDNSTCEIVMAQSYNVKRCTELKMGHYGVRNQGGIVAWFYVIYDLNGQEQRWLSPNLTIGEKASVDVPEKASNVWVRIRYDTGVSTQDILRHPAVGGTPRPEVKCWDVSGAVYSTRYDERTCNY